MTIPPLEPQAGPLARRVSMRLPGLWGLRIVLGGLTLFNNVVGAVVVFCLAALVVPLPPIENDDTVRLENLVLGAIYVGGGLAVGYLRGFYILRRISGWLVEDRPPTAAERRAVLRTPRRVAMLHGLLWSLGAVFFGLWNVQYDFFLGLLVFIVILMGGMTTSAFGYLGTERVLRPLARVALSYGVPRRVGLRMGIKMVLAWVLGSGVLMLGIVVAGLTSLWLGRETSVQQAAITMVVLGSVSLVVGGSMAIIAAKAVSDPIRAVRQSVSRVRHGDLEAEVPIYDGTEVGILQAGFNEMLQGLRERETIRDLFGRHVGDDVARAALEGGVRLGGEVRDVAVLFVDIVGSTTLAAQRPPEEVVAVLNRFFEVVIDVVHAEGGLVNKFEGDAALVIFGAPVPLEDKHAHALRAGRVLGQRLATEIPEIQAGIGVSGGEAVAGNVGAAERYEYTVIGDPVNEAARLTELAKGVPGLVVANARMLALAGEEARHWVELEPVVVRGRTEPTLIARPV